MISNEIFAPHSNHAWIVFDALLGRDISHPLLRRHKILIEIQRMF
jgi:hypothetical protein